MIALTFDIDWAPDFILNDLIELLEKHSVKGTFFATHKSKVIDNIILANHEVGIHPNFNPNFEGKGKHFKTVIDELLYFYPNSQGVRFHSLGHNSHCIAYCSDKGIKYDSSIYFPLQTEPYLDYSGIYRVPHQIADLQLVINGRIDISFDIYNPKLLYVFDFHPFHIFLNTLTLDQVQKAKPFLKNYQRLKSYRTDYGSEGVRSLLTKVLTRQDQIYVKIADYLNEKR